MKQFQNTPLKVGDTVDLVLPASGLPADVIKQAEKFLQSWGLKARYPEEMLKPHVIFAQSDEKRFQFLKDALLNKQSKAVWCLRGGYGSLRLLPALAKLKAPIQSKFFIGISDVTSLHLFLNQKWGWTTYHGSLIDRLANGALPQENAEEIKQILFGDKKQVVFSVVARNALAQKVKMKKAKVTGGNLMTIQSSLGTPYSIKTRKKFLFFEEIGERGYRMDRMLVHLQQAGQLEGCEGLFIGHILGGEEPSSDPQKKNPSTWEVVLQDWLQKIKIPVFSGLQSGHGTDLRCLPLNAISELTRDPSAPDAFQFKVNAGVSSK